MADEAPLQRALEDPAQPLLLLEHRLQLRHLRAQRQSARPHTVRQTSSDQRGRSSIYPWHGVFSARGGGLTSNWSSRRFSRCSSRSMRKYMSFILHRRARGLLKPAPAPGRPRRRWCSEEEAAAVGRNGVGELIYAASLSGARREKGGDGGRRHAAAAVPGEPRAEGLPPLSGQAGVGARGIGGAGGREATVARGGGTRRRRVTVPVRATEMAGPCNA